MCHLDELSAEQYDLFNTLPRGLQNKVERILDSDVRPKATQKIRATFERILKEEGIEPPLPVSVTDAVDMALATYTKAKAVALGA